MRPKIENLARPRGDVAHNVEVVNKGVEMLVGRIGQLAKVGVFGIFEKHFCEVFNWWIREIGSKG